MASNSEVSETLIRQIRKHKKIRKVPHREGLYRLYNEVLLYVRFSKGSGRRKTFAFQIYLEFLRGLSDKSRFFVLLVCGGEDTVVVVPDTALLTLVYGLSANTKGKVSVRVVADRSKLLLKAGRGREIDISEYTNRLDLISEDLPRQQPLFSGYFSEQEDFSRLKQIVMDLDGVKGNSLHQRVSFMLLQLGRWNGYEVASNYKILPDDPYLIDVVWLRTDWIDVAFEIHDEGDETQAKARLIHARRFGARKVVIVSSPPSYERFRKLFRYEATIKNWVELWSTGKIYEMFIAGRHFFPLFNQLNRQIWHKEMGEFL